MALSVVVVVVEEETNKNTLISANDENFQSCM